MDEEKTTLFVTATLAPAEPVAEPELEWTTLDEWGVFNDETSPMIQAMEPSDIRDLALESQFTGTQWEAEQFANHFTQQRRENGSLEYRGPLVIKHRQVRTSEWRRV